MNPKGSTARSSCRGESAHLIQEKFALPQTGWLSPIQVFSSRIIHQPKVYRCRQWKRGCRKWYILL